ncbi:MAG TPA: hypothetical protein DCY25_02210 [Bacteroidales bacterium]|nr:hypothetical protein [Bacteroidales bacterium]
MRMDNLKCIVIILIFLSSIYFPGQAEVAAQTQEKESRYELGFITGAGTGRIAEGHYNVLLLAAHLGYNLKTAPYGLERSGIFSLFIEPQANPIFEPRSDYEAGIGLGAQYLYSLTKKFNPYILASAGPHYLSLNSTDQAPGFNILLTAGAGSYYYLDSKTAINIGWRFRHISNAGMRRPNIGINMHCGVIGLSFFF